MGPYAPPHMLSAQAGLPRLPIPPLEQTVARCVESVAPVAGDDAAALAETRRRAARFLAVGDRLQQRLASYDKTQAASWLEAWWLEAAYLGWREGLCIHSNYWIVMADDPRAYDQAVAAQPLQPADGEYAAGRVCESGGYGEFQIRRAVQFIQRALDYKELVDEGRVPVDRTKAGPLCMHQYTRVFGMTRIPRMGCDELRQDRATVHARTVVVIVQDQLYSVEVYDSAGHRRLDGDLEAELQAVVADVGERAAHGDLDPAVTVLTAGHRDRWAAVHAELEREPGSSATLAAVQESLFAVSLDTTFSDPPDSVNAHQRAAKCHGTQPGHNRWYDKCINFVFDRNGTASYVGEHSPCDALIPAFLIEYVTREAAAAEGLSRYSASARTPGLRPRARRLRFAGVSETARRLIGEAEAEVARAAAASSSRQIRIEGCGAAWIRRVAAVGPDAFAQLALQLAYCRLHGAPAPVYETASTRQFLHGRTENARPLTAEGAAFMRAMCDPAAGALDRYAALVRAATRHQAALREASSGQGIDRHLLGLRLAYQRLAPLPGEGPIGDDEARAIDEFFADPLLAKASTFRLSTSGLFPSHYIAHTGFGCGAAERSYGINYIIGPQWIKFGTEGKAGPAAGGTDVARFEAALRSTVLELKAVCEQASAAGSGSPSRL
ncbi:hypothetical protein H4R18_004900 [Coemansia javaensis]|uniref:Choline/carnitine acyltransferase domain-containing protein n=1 Tax=Coemansia javaensis TaxID=2761396 RepID=A0A9W8LG81_9FUNG|nr:hypothetical protein H4R18_004900 [Coemansia javaensis]